MSLARFDRLYRIAPVLGLAAVLETVVAGLGCGGAATSAPNQPQGMVQVRLGSEPNDRILSLSLTVNSLQATNSAGRSVALLSAPITFEFTSRAVITDPVTSLDIDQGTYSALVFPDMTGEVVFYDFNGQPVTQSFNVPAQTFSMPFVVGADPQVLNVFLDLSQSFTITDPGKSAQRERILPYPAGDGESTFKIGRAHV
jgi:hypothetical protein